MYHINAKKGKSVPGLFPWGRPPPPPEAPALSLLGGGISRWSTSAPCSPPALSLCRPAAIWTWPPGDFDDRHGEEYLTAWEFEAKYLDPDYQPPPAVRPEQRRHSRARMVQPVR